MNRDEAKSILLLYRHGTADADDPQIAEALALAEHDPELKDWLVEHCARQIVLREKFRQIPVPGRAQGANHFRAGGCRKN